MPSITFWTRLEPRCRSDDIAVGLEARTHDPLWMLARQWQLGELLGADAGSPIAATVQTLECALDRYADGSGALASLGGMPLEARVEAEPARPPSASVDYQQAVEAGLHFVRLLRAAHVDEHLIAAYVAQYALAAPDAAKLDAAALRLLRVAAGRVADGIRVAADLHAARPHLPAAPPIPDAASQAVQQVARDFLAWYDGMFDGPRSGSAPSAWVNERMEYQFSLDSSATDRPGAFVADGYTGESLDWTSFDRIPTAIGPVGAAPQSVARTLVPTPVTFKGMPARRYWEMELADVDLGALEAGPTDLGRLMLREFALVYGNDWFLVPLPVRVGSVCRLTSLVVSDTFGVASVIPHYAQTADGGRWRMFAVSGDAPDHVLLLPPAAARAQTSEPIEQVLLVRDEAANLAWGVERLVQGVAGATIDRVSASPPSPAVAPSRPLPRYRLGTSVPEYYIPYVVDGAGAQRRLKRAALLRTDGSRSPILPLGRLLGPDVPLFEEEFAREGVRLERTYRLARWTDGSTHLWLARRKAPGAVAASSGLQFDSVDPA